MTLDLEPTSRLTAETLRLPPIEINRVRELIGRPRLYIRRRAEDIRFEQVNHVRVSVTQTLIVPAVIDDFTDEAFEPPVLNERDPSVADLLYNARNCLNESAGAVRPRLVTLGFFPKRPYPSIEAYDSRGTQLCVLAMREGARLLSGILLALYETDFSGYDPDTGRNDPDWEDVRDVLDDYLELLIRHPPRRLEYETRDYPSQDGYSEDSLETITTEMRFLSRQGNQVAKRILTPSETFPKPGGRSDFEESLIKLSRATHRFAVVEGAVGDRVVVRHTYREPVTFEEVESDRRISPTYSRLARLGIVPRHLTLRARNHYHVHSFSMTVNAPVGSSIEYLLWAQRDEAAGKGWLMEDEVSERGAIVHVRCHNHEDQDLDIQAEMEHQSTGDVIAAFQLQQRGLVRDAALVGLLLTFLLTIGVVFPNAISSSTTSAASLILVLPATAIALLAQRFPEPVTDDFAGVVRRGLIIMALIGFAAASLGGIRIVRSSDWITVLSSVALLFASLLVGLIARLGFADRTRRTDWPKRKPPLSIIEQDSADARTYCVWLVVICGLVTSGLCFLGLVRA